jgi:hypothetical protein
MRGITIPVLASASMLWGLEFLPCAALAIRLHITDKQSSPVELESCYLIKCLVKTLCKMVLLPEIIQRKYEIGKMAYSGNIDRNEA